MTESVKIPISMATPGISRFLNHIRTAGVPTKVNGAYLKSASFRNSNDSALVTTFKLLGFIDDAGIPTDLWKQYRGDPAHGRIVLGNAIKKAYKGLFDLYPDAPSRTDDTIANWIRANTTYGGDSVERAIRTFRALSAEAAFQDGEQAEAAKPTEPPVQAQPQLQPLTPTEIGVPTPARHIPRPSITINIELEIPPTDDPKVYDNFFAAMKKYLFDGD